MIFNVSIHSKLILSICKSKTNNLKKGSCKGRCQNAFPLTTNFSQKFTEPSKWISLVTFTDISQTGLGPQPIHYIVI